MANLIIKPTSGGSLILQDEGGDAAVTVGTTGGATFAQSATFSGTTNNLGTTTAGTLSSGVTFPAGHVIQVRFSNGATTDTTSSTSFQATDIKDTITFTAGNKILCQTGVDTYMYGGGADTGLQIQFSTDDDDGSSNMIGVVAEMYNYGAGSSEEKIRAVVYHAHQFSPSGTSVQVCVKHRAQQGGTTVAYGATSNLILTEIQA